MTGSTPLPINKFFGTILMRNFKFIIFNLFFLLIINVYGQYLNSFEQALLSINKEDIFKNLMFLASDVLKGRAAGSIENEIAAKFIAKKFIEQGLKPAGNYQNINTSNKNEISHELYFQKFEFYRTKLGENNNLNLIESFPNSEKIISFKFKKDFIIQSRNLFDNVKIRAPLVFAGYGIIDSLNDYNDYKDSIGKTIDVKGKIVIIIDGFPREKDTTSFFHRLRNPLYKNPLRKAELAQNLGALALVVANSPYRTEPPFSIKYQSRINAFNKPTDHLPIVINENIPIIYINDNVLSEILSKKRLNLNELLEKIEKQLKGNALEFDDMSLEIEINFDSEIIKTQNVIGLIEGTDEKLKNEYIIIGAHYDHIGLGYYGASALADTGKIHNGADDNASGTSTLIELAEAFSIHKPKRSLIFVAFSGEENGLLGSRFYVYNQPIFPIEKTVAMFNFDMVGRNEPELLWIGGAFYSKDLKRVVELANEKFNFELLYNTGLLNFASDQAPFLRKNIPSIFFFTGLHEDYHTPSDDFDKIDLDKLTRVARLGFTSINIVANSDAKYSFYELPLDERKKLVEYSLEKLRKYRKENLLNKTRESEE